MADNRKESKENQNRWIFKDAMHVVEDLIDALEASKIEYEGRGLTSKEILSSCIQNCVRRYVREIRGNRFWSFFFFSLSAVF